VLGHMEGLLLGHIEGIVLGPTEGLLLGHIEGVVLGTTEGLLLGHIEGIVLGPMEGLLLGHIEGIVLRPTEKLLGLGLVEGRYWLEKCLVLMRILAQNLGKCDGLMIFICIPNPLTTQHYPHGPNDPFRATNYHHLDISGHDGMDEQDIGWRNGWC
jgi:hypothetical protein